MERYLEWKLANKQFYSISKNKPSIFVFNSCIFCICSDEKFPLFDSICVSTKSWEGKIFSDVEIKAGEEYGFVNGILMLGK